MTNNEVMNPRQFRKLLDRGVRKLFEANPNETFERVREEQNGLIAKEKVLKLIIEIGPDNFWNVVESSFGGMRPSKVSKQRIEFERILEIVSEYLFALEQGNEYLQDELTDRLEERVENLSRIMKGCAFLCENSEDETTPEDNSKRKVWREYAIAAMRSYNPSYNSILQAADSLLNAEISRFGEL